MRKNKNNELYEQPLFEDITILTEEEVNDPATPSYKLLTIRGTASKGGFLNKNRRVYPSTTLNKAVERAQAAIAKGKLLGEVDHPDGQGSLANTAIKYTKLWMEGDMMLYEGEVS